MLSNANILAAAIAALLLFLPVTTATAIDGIDEHLTNLYTTAYCQVLIGTDSAAALYDPGNGEDPFCTCLDPSEGASFFVCPGDVTAACLSTTTFSAEHVVYSDTCTTCANSDVCENYVTTDLEFDSACDSDSVLYVSLGLSCDCKPLADLATYEAADYEVCKAPAHGYASCSSTETVSGNDADDGEAYCSFGCDSGYQVSTDGTSCV